MANRTNRNNPIDTAYAKYADQLFRLAYAQLSSAHDAEDAVADVFVRYLDTSPVFRDAEHEKAWLIRVLLNRCRDIHRRKSVRAYTPLEEVCSLAAPQEGSMEILEQIQTLPEKNRTAMLLHYFEGFSLEETARILHTTVSAVKMRLMRGRAALQSTRKGD